MMQRQAAGLAAVGDLELAFVAGAAPETELPAPFALAPGLDYDAFTGESGRQGAEALADSIEAAARRALGGAPDLLHVHNPLIRKNGRLLEALRILRARGIPLLVQIHDLAEDFRPEVFDAEAPYPEDCHYAAINGRDLGRLVAAGLPPDKVHFLPNPVGRDGDFDARQGYALEAERGRRLALYPVRAIGRKNLGEALLLSLFLPEGAELAVTLPPTSPADERVYRAWRELAAARGLRARFEAGLAASLHELYDASFCVLTSSVKEGFGYSYLDPLVRGLPVVGREIPHIVADFAERGVDFPRLYRRLLVPRSALPPGLLREAVEARIRALRQALLPLFATEADRLERRLQNLRMAFGEELLDYGALEPGLQAALLSRAAEDGGFAAELGALNPGLRENFLEAPAPEEAGARREAVLAAYSEEENRRRLLEAYRSAASEGGREASEAGRARIDRAAFAESYLEASAFFLCAS